MDYAYALRSKYIDIMGDECWIGVHKNRVHLT